MTYTKSLSGRSKSPPYVLKSKLGMMGDLQDSTCKALKCRLNGDSLIKKWDVVMLDEKCVPDTHGERSFLFISSYVEVLTIMER
jgi:hypothetical protein